MTDIIKRIEDLMDLFDEGEVTTADKIQRPSDPFREFEERNPMAYGGRIEFNEAGLAKQKIAAKKYGISLKKYQNLSQQEKTRLKDRARREAAKAKGISVDGVKVSKNIRKLPNGTFRFETEAGGGFDKIFPKGTTLKQAEDFRDEKLKEFGIEKGKNRPVNPDRGEYKSVKGQKHIKFNGVTYQVNIQRGDQGSFYTSDLNKAIKKRDELVKKFPPKTMTDYNVKERPKKINAEILKLSKNPTIKNIFKTGVLTKDAITKATNILNVDRATAIDRLENLASAFAGDRKNVPGIKPTNIDNARKIASLLPGAKTKAAELATGVPFIGESIQVPKKEIGRKAPYDTSIFDIDEARATATGLKRGTSPYSIFGQVIDQNVNRIVKGGFKGAGWDSRAGTLEKELDDAIKNFGPNSKEAKAAKFKYNREAAEFESKINKGKLRGTKPIRIPRISLDAPSKTIARYNSFNKKYQSIFDNNFKTKKYSFVIPKDLRTIPELRDDILNPRSATYKNIINTLKKGFNEFDEKKLFEKIKNRTPQQLQKILKKIPRIASVDDFTGPGNFPLTAGLDSSIGVTPVNEKNFFQRNPVTTGTALALGSLTIPSVRKPIIRGAKAVGRTAMKTLGPLAAPLELAFIGSDLKSGSSVPEALANVVMAGGVVRNLEKQKFIEDKYGKDVLDAYNAQTKRGITDYLDMPTAMPELSKRLQTIDAEADQHVLKLRERRAKEFERKSKLPKPEIDEFQAAGGGIAKLAGVDSGPPPSSGPNSQGLQGLMKRGIKT